MKEKHYEALRLWKNGRYDSALLSYLELFGESSDVARYEVEFCRFLRECHLAQAEDVLLANSEALTERYFPRSCKVLCHVAAFVLEKDILRGRSLYERAREFGSGVDRLLATSNLLNSSSLLLATWHIRMLNDATRNGAYAAALARRLRPESRCLDIGTGTGFLALIATRHTEDRVVALESDSDTARLAGQVVAHNGCEGRVIVVPSSSFDFECQEEKFDVVVTETMDVTGFGEGIIATLLDAHRRLTTDDALFIPSKISPLVWLVECEELYDRNVLEYNIEGMSILYSYKASERDEEAMDGMNQESAGRRFVCTDRLLHLPGLRSLSQKTEVFSLCLSSREELEAVERETKTGSFLLLPHSSGEAHALAVAFRAELASDVTLESGTDNSCWDVAFFPFLRPLAVSAGDSVSVDYLLDSTSFSVWPSLPLTKESDRVVSIPEDQQASIEFCNNPAMQRVFGKIGLHRMLTSPEGASTAWPFLPDGSFNSSFDFSSAELRGVSVFGCAFSSSFISASSRLDPSAHLGVDLSEPLRSLNLFEYRNIRHCFQQGSDLVQLSDVQELLNLATSTDEEEDAARLQSKSSLLSAEKSGEAEGIVYWWRVENEAGNSLCSLSAGFPVASFLFHRTMTLSPSEKLEVACHIVEGNFLITIVEDF